MKEEGLLEKFNMEGIDLIHEGNTDLELLGSVEKIRRAYND